MNISGISFAIEGVLFLISAAYFWSVYLKQNHTAIRDLAISFLCNAIFLLLLTWPHFYWQSPELFSQYFHWALVVGFVFNIGGYFYMAQAALRFKWTNFKLTANTLIVLLGVLAIILETALPSKAIIDPLTGVSIFNTVPFVGIAFILAGILSRVLFATIFFLESRKTTDSKLKLRGHALALGALLMFIGGPIHTLARTVSVLLFSDIIFFIGIFLLWVGIFFIRPRPRIENQA